MKLLKLTFFLQAFCLGSLSAQLTFESENLPVSIVADNNGTASVSTLRYKDGTRSLAWEWEGSSVLRINETAAIQKAVNSFSHGGITLWIYNEKSISKPLKFLFKNAQGEIKYHFDYNLSEVGWRACWITFKNMWTPSGTNPVKENITYIEIASPEGIEKGRIFLDRCHFITNVNVQTAPDAQIPKNNRFLKREMWHWGRLWEWEQLKYDKPLAGNVDGATESELNQMVQSIKEANKGSGLTVSVRNELVNKVSNTLKIGIKDGVITGAPLVYSYEPVKDSGDFTVKELIILLDQLARGWYVDNDKRMKTAFVDVMRYAMDQGFAFGSAMGTNHHYGYEIRSLFPVLLWMKDALKEGGIWDETRKMATYWSGLQETRQPYDVLRDEITDSWNTLLIPRLCCALMYDGAERFRAVQCYMRWLSGSLCFTSGSNGGIKVDGTAFHHGGHYPAYSVPGYNSIGEVLQLTNGTQFGIEKEAKDILKFALQSARNYSNTLDWGLASCGRHPFNGRLNAETARTFANLALSAEPVDTDLAADYLRLGTDATYKNQFLNMGIEPALPPNGFYNYNYGCFGVFRDNNWMVSLKGMNKWVWGSEIYVADNRYGRYLSYGLIQILANPASEPSEANSGFTESGWDWNRIPGTTTIHLPIDKLESPLKGTLMARSPETFAGTSSLRQKYGMFVIKLKEANFANFTPSFVARKSAFCVGNRIVCLGSGITNSNTSYPTETTLFQQSLSAENDGLYLNGSVVTTFPLNDEFTTGAENAVLLSDLTGNYYRIESGQKVVVLKQEQSSKHNKTKAATKGKFASAYLDHGTAPDNAKYEYQIIIQPSEKEKENLTRKSYIIHQHSPKAHIVEDIIEKVTGYALFDAYSSSEDRFIASATAETIVMLQTDVENRIKASVGDPDINTGDTSFTSPSPSRKKTKEILFKGKWMLAFNNENVQLENIGDNTKITVTLIHGQSVDFELVDMNLISPGTISHQAL